MERVENKKIRNVCFALPIFESYSLKTVLYERKAFGINCNIKMRLYYNARFSLQPPHLRDQTEGISGGVIKNLLIVGALQHLLRFGYSAFLRQSSRGKVHKEMII